MAIGNRKSPINILLGTFLPYPVSKSASPSGRLAAQAKGCNAMVSFICLEASICLLALIDETSTDFNDLGKLMLAGFAAAIVFALGFTFVRLRLREKAPQTSNFISIISTQDKNEEADN